ncbi:MAG: GxxExxY protein [Xanthomonadales bacterium]|nr:GxxExxY protein [Xanthomonadales bacterium]
MIYQKLTSQIISCAIEVHKQLGPGLLESAYQECMLYELVKSELKVEKETPVPITYKEIKLNQGYRIDLLVEGIIVVELKSVDKLTDIHKSQLLTYLKLGKFKLGLLINFNVPILKNGIKRLINDREKTPRNSASPPCFSVLLIIQIYKL